MFEVIHVRRNIAFLSVHGEEATGLTLDEHLTLGARAKADGIGCCMALKLYIIHAASNLLPPDFIPTQASLFSELLLLRVDPELQLTVLFLKFSHVDLDVFDALSGPLVLFLNESSVIVVRCLLLDAVHAFDHSDTTPFLSLSPDLSIELLLRHVSFLLFLRRLICLLLL